MIQANEVRIGNVVSLSERTPAKPEYVGTNHVIDAKDFCNDFFHYYDPMPISGEVLELYGFKKYSHEPGYAIGSEEKNERCDEYTLGKITIMDWGEGLWLSNSFSFDLRVELKSLHQLQNLYYSLTGQELQYTP